LQDYPTFVTEHWGDIASVVGVGISLVGFGITIWGVLRSKKAAQRAEEAAHDVKTQIFRTDTIEDLAAAITTMEEIKRLHRVNNAWPILPDRYSSVRRLLISIRTFSPYISEEQKESLLASVQHFSDMEKKVEKYLANSEQQPPNAARLNEIVSLQLDRVNDTLFALRQQIGIERHE
jgi:ERCC4-type nuclease